MATRVRHSLSERRRLVAEFYKGGLDPHVFCRLYAIKRSTLSAWIREANKVTRFVPVKVEPAPVRVGLPPGRATSCGARLVGPRGTVLEFLTGADATWVADVCGRLL
jgi:hypothetical protein